MLEPLSTIGIGSVPFVEGENACERIFERWDIPFWPQYPARDPRENFTVQFLRNFPGIRVDSRKVAFDRQGFDEEKASYRFQLEEAFRRKDFTSFEPRPEWALGYAQMKELLSQGVHPEKSVVKVQITGPGTVRHALLGSEKGKDSDQEIFRLLLQTLTASGLAQIQRIRNAKRNPLIFIDEPLISTDLGPLTEMVEAFKKTGTLVGLHLCSSAGWRGLGRLNLDLFHFDLSVQPEPDKFARDFLRNLIQKGKWIVWGVIPTRPAKSATCPPTPKGVRHLFFPLDYSGDLVNWAEKITWRDLSLEGILKHSLLAPACGAGTLTEEQDQMVFQRLQLTRAGLEKLLVRERAGSARSGRAGSGARPG